MKLQTMLGKLETATSAQPKTANDRSRRPGSEGVDAAISKAMDAINTEKVASATEETAVVPGLMKIANDLMVAEKNASAQDSIDHGRLMARGFIDEMAQYTKAAHDLGSSQRQATNGDDALLQKLSEEYPGEYRGALQQGYNDQRSAIEKNAHEKLAADQALLEKFASEDPNTFEAAVERGYKEAGDELVKHAQAEFNKGYVETIHTHRKLAAHHFAMGFDAMNQAAQIHKQQRRA